MIGERLVLMTTAAGQAAASGVGYFAAPAFSAIVCAALGVSLRGSLRYRRLATALTTVVAVAVVLLKVRAVLRGRLTPSTGTVLDDVFFAAAIVPLLARAPTRGHVRLGYVFGCLWLLVEVVFLVL